MISLDSPEFRLRFWGRVQPAGDDDCWPWMRACQSKGYGQIYIGETAHRAHRIAYYLVNGEWPVISCHSCDNPICCNPKHIKNGTYKSNMQERSERGRCNSAKGEKCGRSKLKDSQVLAIREEYARGGITHREIAAKYGVSGSLVTVIINRRFWRHI